MSDPENTEATGHAEPTPNTVQAQPGIEPVIAPVGDERDPAVDVEQDEDAPGKTRKAGETGAALEAGAQGEHPEKDEEDLPQDATH